MTIKAVKYSVTLVVLSFWFYTKAYSQGYIVASYDSEAIRKYNFSIQSLVVQPSFAMFLYMPEFKSIPQTLWYFPSVDFLYSVSFSKSDNLGRYSTSGIGYFGLGVGSLFNFPYEGSSVNNYDSQVEGSVSKRGFADTRLLYPYLIIQILTSGGMHIPAFHFFLGAYIKLGYLMDYNRIANIEWESRNIFWMIGLRLFYGLDVAFGYIYGRQFTISFGATIPVGFSSLYWNGTGRLTEEHYTDIVVKWNPPRLSASLFPRERKFLTGTNSAIEIVFENSGLHAAINVRAIVVADKEDRDLFLETSFLIGDVAPNQPLKLLIPLTIGDTQEARTVKSKLLITEQNGYVSTSSLDIIFEIIENPFPRRKRPPED